MSTTAAVAESAVSCGASIESFWSGFSARGALPLLGFKTGAGLIVSSGDDEEASMPLNRKEGNSAITKMKTKSSINMSVFLLTAAKVRKSLEFRV